jgi:hypothetical protein
MIAFDTTFLTLMLVPGARHEISDAKERIEFLISDIHGSREKVIIPTPALSEVLIKSGQARDQIINLLTKSDKFLVAPFDTLCALELSLMVDAAFARKDKRDGAPGTWVKVKFDRQIVSIAKVFGARAIYSEDGDLRAIAVRNDLPCYGVSDIKIPEADQGQFWRSQS